jgi:hypothetical protein
MTIRCSPMPPVEPEAAPVEPATPTPPIADDELPF